MAVVNGWDVFAGHCHTTSELKTTTSAIAIYGTCNTPKKRYIYLVSEALNIY